MNARPTRRTRSAAARAVVLALLVALALPAEEERRGESDLQNIRKEVRALQKRLNAVQTEARSVERDLREVELQLAIETKELELALEAWLALTEQQRDIEERIALLVPQIRKRKQELATRLSALYRLGRLSYLRLLLSIEERQHTFQAVGMLRYLIARDARSVSEFEEITERLRREEASLVEKKAFVQRARADVEQRRRAIAARRAEKARVLARLESESHRSAERIASLEEKAQRLERLISLLYDRSEDGQNFDGGIADYKGALEWPAKGRVTESFGKHRSSRFATYVMSNGIWIGADPGSAVRVVFNGTVLYSQWFKGYGNLIVIDHGARIFTLYGNIHVPHVSAGGRVKAGEVVGTVGYDEEEHAGRLYFEVRQNNQPVDPAEWLR